MMRYKHNPRGFRRISLRSRSRRQIYNPQIIPDRPVIFASCTESRTTCILRQRRDFAANFLCVTFQSNARLFFPHFLNDVEDAIDSYYSRKHKILGSHVCARGHITRDLSSSSASKDRTMPGHFKRGFLNIHFIPGA